jgi:hypothetical protein
MITWSRNYDEYVIEKYGKEYLDAIRTPARYQFPTKEGMRYFPYFCYRFNINSVIDYGAGYHRMMEVPSDVSVVYYDPYIKDISRRPEQSADAIILYNVINGIEPDFIEEFLDDVRKLCNEYVFCVLRTPGLYGTTIETYREKFVKRGFIIFEEHLQTLDEFYEKTENSNFDALFKKRGARIKNEMYFAILKKDPNF